MTFVFFVVKSRGLADYFDEVGHDLAGVEVDPLAVCVSIGQTAGLFALDPHEGDARQNRLGSALGGRAELESVSSGHGVFQTLWTRPATAGTGPFTATPLAVAVRCAISSGNLRPRATSWAAVASTFSSKAARKNSASGIADSPARLAAQRTAANSSCVKAHFRLRKACRFIPAGLGAFGPGKGVPTESGS